MQTPNQANAQCKMPPQRYQEDEGMTKTDTIHFMSGFWHIVGLVETIVQTNHPIVLMLAAELVPRTVT